MSSGELLDIQPQELQFPFELRKQVSCSLRLCNKTDNYVAFKVKTTNPKMYCACPDTGVVLPRSTCDVTVTMQAQMEAPAELQCNDKLFLFQSTEDSNPEMFNREAECQFNREAECQLKVVYVAPPRPPSPVREGSDEDSSPRVSVSENGHSYVELPGSSATGEQILHALLLINGVLLGPGGVLNSMIDGETQNWRTSMPGRNHSSGEYNNIGEQMIRGLCNQTGHTKGDYNGAVRCSLQGDFQLHQHLPPQPSQSCTRIIVGLIFFLYVIVIALVFLLLKFNVSIAQIQLLKWALSV